MKRMKIVDRALGYVARKALMLMQSYSLTDPLFGKVLRGNSTASSKAVDENTSLQISAFWACVRILSTTIGYLPWGMYERQKNGNLVPVDHDLAAVLMDSPNANMTDLELKEALTANLAVRGNSYSIVTRRSDGGIIAIQPVPSSICTKNQNSDGSIVYKIQDRGKLIEFPPEMIWDTRLFSYNGLNGLSPIAYARESLGLSLATEEFQARFFAQGASFGWAISTPAWLTENQREEARKIVQDQWSGLPNAHRARLLEGGMTATPTTMPLADAQFLELRNYGVNEVCRWMGIPPHMVAQLNQSTNNNIEHQGLEFLLYGLQPYLARIERSARRWLLSTSDRASNIEIKFDVRELLRADSATKAVLFPAYVGAGIMNRNEVRAIEGWNSVPELDTYTVGVNLIPIDRLQEYADKLVSIQAAPTRIPEPGTGGTPAKVFDLRRPT